MSCALDKRFGMSALKDALIVGIKNKTLTENQIAEWCTVATNLQNGIGLESALNFVTDQDLLKTLTRITGSFIADLDREFCYKIVQNLVEWPALQLFRKLVEGLPEGDHILHVLTPNYDMLFEYACDSSGIPYTNGFFGGIARKENWKAISQAFLEPEKICQGRKIKTVYRHRKRVHLYKVHGSLNYFFHLNTVLENNAWMWEPPDFAERLMITPGLSKFQILQKYRQELLQSADIAIDKATNFLFLGYGFNDSHLEEYIKRKLIKQACHGLIVTRSTNPRIEALLGQADNLWLVCKTGAPVGEGTQIYNKGYSNSLKLPGKNLWDIREFTKHILGG